MDLRLFISVPVPDPGPLEPVLRELRTVYGIRTVPAGQLHITLRFLGDTDERRLDDVVSACRRAVRGTELFEIVLKGAGVFPNARNPRVVWIGVRPEDVLSGLSERITSELKGFSMDEKPFKGHITIARCREPVQLKPFLEKYSDTEFARFRCGGICVMKSELSERGAKHTVLSNIRLG